MSEQDDASVERFLDGLDDRRNEVAGENERRRSRRAVPAWEYQTWTTADTKVGRSIRPVNGERFEEYPLESSALVEAGAQGWADAEIAEHLGFKKDSVTALMSKTIAKLRARSRAPAVTLCFRAGVLT